MIKQNANAGLAAAPRSTVVAGGRKLQIFARSNKFLTGALDSISDSPEFQLLHYDRLDRARAVKTALADFVKSNKRHLVFSIFTRHHCDVAIVCQFIDEADLGDKTATVLVSFPGRSMHFQRYPALFSFGWDSFFLDAGTTIGTFLLNQFAKVCVRADGGDGGENQPQLLEIDESSDDLKGDVSCFVQ
jgi:hypothetical protein